LEDEILEINFIVCYKAGFEKSIKNMC